MFATNFHRASFQARTRYAAISWRQSVIQSKQRPSNERYINFIAGIPGGKWRCSTFIFRIQHAGQSLTSSSLRTCKQNCERHNVIPFSHVSRRYYKQNHVGVLNCNNKSSRWTLAVGLIGSLVCLGMGWYKLKTEVHSCDSQQKCHQDTIIPGEEKKRKSLTLQEAIDRSRDLAMRIKDESGSPGLVISVSVNGKEVWNEGLGYADVENRVPCSADTVLRIASISKSITMVAVAKQLEAGTLDLDKPVQHYIPNFPEKTVDGKKVTITTRHLVSHLGGIRHYHKNTSKPKDDTEASKTMISSDKKTEKEAATAKKPEMTLEEYLISDHYKSVTDSMNLFKDDPLVHEPGSKYLYTTFGFTLLSAVLEAIAKTPFEKLMKEYFVEMGMDNTYLDENTPLIYNRGRHYMKNKNGRLINTPYVDLSYKWAGGGLLSTTRDLIKFGHVMLYSFQHESGASDNKQWGQSSKDISNKKQKSKVIASSHQEDRKGKTPGFLKRESVQLLWEPVAKTKCAWDKFGCYGMGWAVTPEGENFGKCHHSDHFVSHTGGAIGGSSVLLIKPKNCDMEHSREPQGVVVAMIVNMTAVSLYKTAVKVAELFEEAVS